MHDSVLYPPNYTLIGNNIIRQVVQCSGLPSNDVVLAPHPDSKGPEQQSKASSTQNDKEHNSTSEPSELTVREQRRQNMARYRKKLRDRTTSCEQDIRRLREEIERLQRHRQIIASDFPTKSTSWNVASEFFRLFRHGVKDPVPCTETLSRQGAHVQLEFLQAVMAPGFICNGNCGIEAMLKAVKTISYGFLDLDIRLVRLEGVADDVVTATATTTFTITEAALQHTFPHLVGETGDWSQLANKLLGQRIVTEGVTTFLWDVENERVIRMETKSDLMTPLVRILGGLDDASRVFQNALLTPEGYCSDSFAS